MAENLRVHLVEDHVVLCKATAELVDHQLDMRVVGQAGTGKYGICCRYQLFPEISS